MSPVASETAELLSTARSHAAENDWRSIHDLLGGHEVEVSSCPELATLVAEAELRLCNPAAARSRLLDALPALERSGNSAVLPRAFNLTGAAHFVLGDLCEAEAAFERAFELANAAGDDLIVARAVNNLGAIANIRGRHDSALSHYLIAVPLYQRIGSSVGLAETFHNMAISFRDTGQFGLADKYEARAIEFAREGGNARLTAMAQVGRAELSLLRGDAHLAEAGARLAVRQYRSLRDPLNEAEALRLVGLACSARGAADEALDALNGAVTLAHDHGVALIEAESLRARAEALARLRDLDRARSDAEDALAIFTRLGAHRDCATVEALAKEFRAN